jgi:hypothetical protein
MPREAGLFDVTNGNVVDAFLILRSEGKNIPPNWIDRAEKSRKNRQPALGKLLKIKSLDAVQGMKDWELAYKKECFYYGLRVLMELERNGKTKL